MVIPAHPLALTASRRLDERRQRALTRYYLDAGAGGIAVGVHTTQFAIRHPRHGLLRPVLELAMDTVRTWPTNPRRPVVRVAGVIGPRRQALREARLAADLGYDCVLLGLGALGRADDRILIEHCRAVAEVLPVMGFYLQPAVGGRRLGYRFWRGFAELENVVAIKVAPFNRYDTLDVVRAVADAGRAGALALYTGNDDNIVADLLTDYAVPVPRAGRTVRVRMVGGLLGHWAFWTSRAVALHRWLRSPAGRRAGARPLLGLAARITDANGAVFDAGHGFAGCLPGIHEVLRRQGLLRGRWCLDPREELSSGQMAEIDRVWRMYPELRDDRFVRRGLERWLAD